MFCLYVFACVCIYIYILCACTIAPVALLVRFGVRFGGVALHVAGLAESGWLCQEQEREQEVSTALQY